MNGIVISGYYGSNNAGDEAMLEAIIGALRERLPDVPITVLSASPARTEAEYGVNAVNRFDLFSVWSSISKCSLLVSGGGSLFQDSTSLRSLMYYSLIVFLAKMLGKKVIIYGQGFGPLRSPLGRFIAKVTYRLADLITVRDPKSGRELSALGVASTPVYVAADPAFSLKPPEDDLKVNAFLEAEGLGLSSRPLVGFALRPWKNQSRYIPVLAKAADHLQSSLKAQVVFIPMQVPNDVAVSEKVAALMKRPATILRRSYKPRELISIIGKLDLLIGIRLHSLVFAAISGVPMVALSYDPKVLGLIEYLDIEQQAVNLTEDLSLEDFLVIAETVWRKRELVKKKLKEKLPALREAALKSADFAASLIAQRV